MGTTAGPLPPSYVTSGLIFHIDSDNTASYPGSGTDWNSLVDANNNGEIEDAAMFVAPNMTYDNDNQWAKFPQPSGNEIIANTMSVDYWFYQTHTPATNNDGLIAVNAADSFFIRQHHYTVGPPDKGWLYFYPRGNTTYVTDVDYFSGADAFIDLDAWNHIAITIDNATIVYYHNGVDAGTPTNAAITAGPPANTSDMYIGNTASLAYDFHGMIDIVRVYNRVLDADEVLKNFDAEKGRFGL